MSAPIPTNGSSRAPGARVLLALADYAIESPSLHLRYQQHLDMWRNAILRSMLAARDDGSIRTDADYPALADRYMAMAVGSAVMEIMYPAGEKTPTFAAFIDDTLASLTTQPAVVSTIVADPLAASSTNVTAEPDDAFFAIMSTTIDEDDLDSRPVHRHDVMFSNSTTSDDLS